MNEAHPFIFALIGFHVSTSCLSFCPTVFYVDRTTNYRHFVSTASVSIGTCSSCVMDCCKGQFCATYLPVPSRASDLRRHEAVFKVSLLLHLFLTLSHSQSLGGLNVLRPLP